MGENGFLQMTLPKSSIEARDKMAIDASSKYVDDWTKQQTHGFINHTTYTMRANFIPGFEAGFEKGYTLAMSDKRCVDCKHYYEHKGIKRELIFESRCEKLGLDFNGFGEQYPNEFFCAQFERKDEI